jgi:hypothetical protein
MDRDEALRLLHGGSEGVKQWNRRWEARASIPMLGAADLTGAKHSRVNLTGAYLRSAPLHMAKLTSTDRRVIVLRVADLREAVLRGLNSTGSISLHFSRPFCKPPRRAFSAERSEKFDSQSTQCPARHRRAYGEM